MDGLVYQSQAFGGISRVFTEILPRMCDLNDRLNITLFTQGRLRQSLPRHHRITHLPIPDPEPLMRPGWFFKPLIPSFCRFIRKLYIPAADEDIWHSTYYTIPKKWKGYSIVTVHDMIHERFPDLYNSKNDERFRAVKRHCIRQADAVICVSENTRKDLLYFYKANADSVHVIPNACSDIFKKGQTEGNNIEASTEQPFLLYVGSRARYKNFDLLIHAYSKWPQRKEINLLFVGGKPWSQSEQRVLTDLGIQNQVKLLRDVDDKTLCRLYNSAVAFVYPSLYEGFGIPLLEAMACGCPIIASRIPSTIEVAKDCPIYFDPAEEDGLLNALDIALSQGRNSKRIWAELERVKSYSWDKTAAQTLEVYRAVYSRA
jgi:glycosyltransferase involved in cell wall biosynthesis